MDLSRGQRTALWIAAASIVVAAIIGFWPLSVRVIDGSSYSCGSGFVHSRHTWKVDSRALLGTQNQQLGFSQTPNTACPGKVYGRRDFAFTLAGFALVGGVAAVALLTPDPFERLRSGR